MYNMSWARTIHKRNERFIKTIGCTSEGRKPFERRRCRFEDNIKSNSMKIMCENVECIQDMI